MQIAKATIKLSVFVLSMLGIFPSNKSLPLPESEKGVKSVTGNIVKCDFQELGSWGLKVFAGIKLDKPQAPYLRFNFLRTEWPKFQQKCDDKALVTISYIAKSTELRPQITYWGQDIQRLEKKDELESDN